MTQFTLFDNGNDQEMTITFWDQDGIKFHIRPTSDEQVLIARIKETQTYADLGAVRKKEVAWDWWEGAFSRHNMEPSPNQKLIKVAAANREWNNSSYIGTPSNPIDTIKLIRLLSGCGLKEAKDFYEDYVRDV